MRRILCKCINLHKQGFTSMRVKMQNGWNTSLVAPQ